MTRRTYSLDETIALMRERDPSIGPSRDEAIEAFCESMMGNVLDGMTSPGAACEAFRVVRDDDAAHDTIKERAANLAGACFTMLVQRRARGYPSEAGRRSYMRLKLGRYGVRGNPMEDV